MLIVIFCLAMVFLVVVGANMNMPKPYVIPEPPPLSFTARVKTKAKPKVKAVDPLIASAKATLVTLGFSATEATKLLSGVTGATVEEYVSQAMKKVKI